MRISSRFNKLIAALTGGVLIGCLGGFLIGKAQQPARQEILSPSPPFVSVPSPAAGSLPTTTEDVDVRLGIPAVIRRPNNVSLKPYLADRKGLRLKYEADVFKSKNSDFLYVPQHLGQRIFLPWQSSEKGAPGLFGIYPGNLLTVLDDALYDLSIGPLMVKARIGDNGPEGFVQLSTIVGDTVPGDDQLWGADEIARLKKSSLVNFEGITLYAYGVPKDMTVVQRDAAILLDPSSYNAGLSGGNSGGVHPVYAANVVVGLLQLSLTPGVDSVLKSRIQAGAEKFFESYIFPEAVEQAPGAVSWPYRFAWTTNWGVALIPPWYSAYTNGVISSAAAIMFRLTKDERYRDMALKAGRYLGLDIEKGGAEYEVSGFRLPAEYVYPVARTPNIRVLDGEIIALIHLYNAARLLSSWELYDIFVRQAFSLAAQLEFFRNEDGSLIFAAYLEKMPEHYVRDVWLGLLMLANMTKDRTFLNSANALKRHIPAKWCASDGC